MVCSSKLVAETFSAPFTPPFEMADYSCVPQGGERGSFWFASTMWV